MFLKTLIDQYEWVYLTNKLVDIMRNSVSNYSEIRAIRQQTQVLKKVVILKK